MRRGSGPEVPPNPPSRYNTKNSAKNSIAYKQLRKQTRGLFPLSKRDGNTRAVKGGYLSPVRHKVPLILDSSTFSTMSEVRRCQGQSFGVSVFRYG